MRLYLRKIITFFKGLLENWPSYRQSFLTQVKKGWDNRPNRKQWGQLILLSMAAGFAFLFLFVGSVYLGLFGKLPSKADLLNIKNANASEIYSGDNILLGKYYHENRTNASLQEIPHHLINALVATEDARYYTHGGIDPRALTRVLFRTMIMGDLDSGGGSTISQQLIKNLFPRKRHSFLSVPVNKVREMILARRIEKLYSKAQIMELYLNTVPFGENDVYGVKVAAKRFFNSPINQLKVEESAVLVGMLKGNTLYNPITRPEASKDRRNTVLRRMVEHNFLQQVEYDSLSQLPLETNYVREGRNQGLATYFRSHLKPVLNDILKDIYKPDGSTYQLENDGLRIYTTIDSRLQKHAEEAVNENMPSIQENFYTDWKKRKSFVSEKIIQDAVRKSKRYQSLKKGGKSEEEIKTIFDTPVPMNLFSWKEDTLKMWSPLDSVKHYLSILNTGLIAVDPHTGLVKAWVGGIDHGYFQYDHIKARRQVGSTFKPVVYAQALEEALYPCDYFENKRQTYPEYEDWSPRNSNGKYGGYYTMPGALSQSVNTVTVQLIMDTGVDSVRALAQQLGIKGEIPEGPAISLGTMDASLLEMIQVYSTFANDGKKPELHYLDRIEDRNGKIIYQRPRPNPEVFEQVISEESNALLVNMLESVVDSGTARKLRYRYGLRNPMAGKTGTTQNQSDGWFLGFSPNLAVGVWVGAELPSVHFRTLYRGQGASTALPIAGSFLQKTYKDKRFRSWRKAEFSPLVDSLAYVLDCPHYIEDIPVAEEYLDAYFDNPGFFDRLNRELGDRSPIPIQLKRKRHRESEEDYLDRMRRYNERVIKRQEKKREDLKKFWGDKLFGNQNKKKEEEEAKKKNNERRN